MSGPDTVQNRREGQHTLLLRLAGPMQSWGVQSQFTIRDTAVAPSKSGVVGLLCAALGRPRDADIDDLARLRMAVRVDRAGEKRRDFHTAGKDGFLRARGQVETENVITTERYYLSDAHFTVGLEGSDLALLREVHDALSSPHWPLSLGRKAFPPGLPVYLTDGLKPDTSLLEAFQAHPWIAGEKRRTWRDRPEDWPDKLRLVVELDGEGDDPFGWGEPVVRRTQRDQPLSFQPRQFAMRTIGVYRRPATELLPDEPEG